MSTSREKLLTALTDALVHSQARGNLVTQLHIQTEILAGAITELRSEDDPIALRKQLGGLAVLILQNEQGAVLEWARGVKITFPDGAPMVSEAAPDANCIFTPDGGCEGCVAAGKAPCMHDFQLPPLFATVYVFGVHRKIDTAPWFVAFKDQAMADNYPERCTEVAAVALYPLGGDPIRKEFLDAVSRASGFSPEALRGEPGAPLSRKDSSEIPVEVNDYQEWCRRCVERGDEGPYNIAGHAHQQQFVRAGRSTSALYNFLSGKGTIFP